MFQRTKSNNCYISDTEFLYNPIELNCNERVLAVDKFYLLGGFILHSQISFAILEFRRQFQRRDNGQSPRYSSLEFLTEFHQYAAPVGELDAQNIDWRQ